MFNKFISLIKKLFLLFGIFMVGCFAYWYFIEKNDLSYVKNWPNFEDDYINITSPIKFIEVDGHSFVEEDKRLVKYNCYTSMDTFNKTFSMYALAFFKDTNNYIYEPDVFRNAQLNQIMYAFGLLSKETKITSHKTDTKNSILETEGYIIATSKNDKSTIIGNFEFTSKSKSTPKFFSHIVSISLDTGSSNLNTIFSYFK